MQRISKLLRFLIRKLEFCLQAESSTDNYSSFGIKAEFTQNYNLVEVFVCVCVGGVTYLYTYMYVYMYNTHIHACFEYI